MRTTVANRAPISFARCPLHGRKVARDGEGRLLGCCDACKREAAAGMRVLADQRKKTT